MDGTIHFNANFFMDASQKEAAFAEAKSYFDVINTPEDSCIEDIFNHYGYIAKNDEQGNIISLHLCPDAWRRMEDDFLFPAVAKFVRSGSCLDYWHENCDKIKWIFHADRWRLDFDDGTYEVVFPTDAWNNAYTRRMKMDKYKYVIAQLTSGETFCLMPDPLNIASFIVTHGLKSNLRITNERKTVLATTAGIFLDYCKPEFREYIIKDLQAIQLGEKPAQEIQLFTSGDGK